MEFQIENRYSATHRLVKENDAWHFYTSKDCLYSSSGFKPNSKELEFYDPEGGPFICIGMKLSDLHSKAPDDIIKEIKPETGYVNLIV